jgi:Flp pilus assembly secretin CpaC
MTLALFLVLAAAPKPSSNLGGAVTLEVGEQKVVTAPCSLQRLAVDATPPTLSRIALGDASIVDIKTIGNNQIVFIGGGEGQTTILGWCSNGQRISWLVKVVPAGTRPRVDREIKVKQSAGSAKIVDESGVRDTQVTVVEIPGDLVDVEEVKSPDGRVTLVGYDSAHRRVTITATPYVPRSRPKPDAGAPRDGG